MTISNEDIEKIKKFIDIRKRGHYCNGGELTEVYNRVLNANLRPTNCSSCIISRLKQLEDALNAYKRLQEALKKEEPNDSPQDENKPLTEANAGENKPPEKKVGRPKKQ